MSVRFAPGGATFASLASNGGGRLSRASDGGMVAAFSHYKAGGSLAFSPDGQWLASGGERYIGGDIIDSASQVTVWRATDATLVRSFNFSSLGGRRWRSRPTANRWRSRPVRSSTSCTSATAPTRWRSRAIRTDDADRVHAGRRDRGRQRLRSAHHLERLERRANRSNRVPQRDGRGPRGHAGWRARRQRHQQHLGAEPERASAL